MVDLDDSVIARITKDGERFEVLIDPTAAQKFREGEDIDLMSSLASDVIFKDSKKGDKASEEKIEELFGTTEVEAVAREILEKGDIQLTTEQRKKMQESKRKKILATIARNAINPQTGAPHPMQRLELAMDEAKIHIDPFKSVDVQVNEVLDALRPIIPIRFEKIKLAVKLGGEDYGKCFADITSMATILREEWLSDGSWVGVVELPAGLQLDFFDRLNQKTKGNVESKIMK